MRDRNSERGMTVIELAIAAAVLVIVVAVVGKSVKPSFGFYRTSTSRLDLERKANRGLEKVLDGLQRVPLNSILPQLSSGETSPFIDYQKIVGFTDGTPVFGPTHRLEWQADPEDPEDSVDNNGNGLVDERGLCFEMSGQLLTIRVTLLRVAEDQSVVSWTGTGSVALR